MHHTLSKYLLSRFFQWRTLTSPRRCLIDDGDHAAAGVHVPARRALLRPPGVPLLLLAPQLGVRVGAVVQLPVQQLQVEVRHGGGVDQGAHTVTDLQQ